LQLFFKDPKNSNDMHYQSLLLAPFALFLTAIADPNTFEFPNSLHDGPITAQFNSLGGNIDGPKISSGVNASTYEWSVP
jgi:hypothetical protein